MKLLIFFAVFIAISSCAGEMFSSVDELVNLRSNHEALIHNLEILIENLEDVVEDFKSKLKSMKVEHDLMANDSQKYVENPLNAFLLIKSLSYDVDFIQNSLNDVTGDYNDSIKELRLPMSDFDGACEGFWRIQRVYKLPSEDIAAGILDGVKYREELKTDEILALAVGLVKYDSDFAANFFKIALNKSDEESKDRILEKLFEIYANSKKYDEALDILAQRIKIDPENEELVKLQINFELIAMFPEKNKEILEEDEIGIAELDMKVLSLACRGLLTKNISELSKLTCRFHSTTPFTRIAPFKLEVVNELPFVGIIHEAISDHEIDFFKAKAKENLFRAQVLEANSTGVESRTRVAKLSYLYEAYDQTKLLQRVHDRVGDMFGLNMKTAESWQVQNYGIGGHYQLHHDFSYEGFDFNTFTGNRIASALFYLSNVEKGGATVFPLLRLYVAPKKGSVVIWHNLSTSGHREYLTYHAACPVLVGAKWVANKWLHEFGQEFKRPCELHAMETTEEDIDERLLALIKDSTISKNIRTHPKRNWMKKIAK